MLRDDDVGQTYFRLGGLRGIEPIVWVLQFYGVRPPALELSEEDRLFHDWARGSSIRFPPGQRLFPWNCLTVARRTRRATSQIGRSSFSQWTHVPVCGTGFKIMDTLYLSERRATM